MSAFYYFTHDADRQLLDLLIRIKMRLIYILIKPNQHNPVSLFLYLLHGSFSID